MKTLEEAKRFFANDIFAVEVTGIEILQVGKAYAKCSLHVQKKHLNASHVVMGGVLFTLADFTFAVAANIDQPLTVSLSSQITYLNPARGEYLFAEAVCEKTGKRSCTFTITITDEHGAKIALVSATGMRIADAAADDSNL